jgi:Zn-dependent protease with chaperone function
MNHETLKEFPGLSAAAFQHGSDVQATENLQKIPFLPFLLKKLSGSLFERQMRLMNIAYNVRLGPHQGKALYDKFVKAATILDLPDLPEIYINSQYTMNATAFGLEKYQITLYAGLVDFLNEAELMAVIGHELGHVKCQHMLYKTMVYILRYFGVGVLTDLLPAGTGTLASISLQLAILNWERMAELSCDRAALLVVQDPQVVASAVSKLAGGSKNVLPEINLEAILEQAEDYHDTDLNLMEQIFKVNMMLRQTHPFPIVRAKEIIDWGASDHYRDILHGDYVHHDGSAALLVTEPVSRVCPTCKRQANASAITCRGCGGSLKKARLICSNCRIKVFAAWATCPGCGSQLKPDEAKQAA